VALLSLWKAREASTRALNEGLCHENEVICEGFAIADALIDAFHQAHEADEEDQYAFVCGLTLLKGRYYALGYYSLCLDGMPNEAGSLLRLLQEITEMLTYFRLDPLRIQQALEGTLPSAGEIARRIEGKAKFFRDYANEHLSHFGFTGDAVGPLLVDGGATWRVQPVFDQSLLRISTGWLFVFLELLNREGVQAVPALQELYDALRLRFLRWAVRGAEVFRGVSVVGDYSQWVRDLEELSEGDSNIV